VVEQLVYTELRILDERKVSQSIILVAVIRVFDDAGNVMETHEQDGRTPRVAAPQPMSTMASQVPFNDLASDGKSCCGLFVAVLHR